MRTVRKHLAYIIIVLAVAFGFYAQGRDRADLRASVEHIERVDVRTTPFAPFSHNESTLAGADAGVPLGGTIHFKGSLCNSLDHPVETNSSLTWVAVDEHDQPIARDAWSSYIAFPFGARPPGCVQAEFPWLMPFDVVRNELSLNAEHVPHRWIVSAKGIPVKADGSSGIPDIFTSKPFDIVQR